jgi:hypothetical protein
MGRGAYLVVYTRFRSLCGGLIVTLFVLLVTLGARLTRIVLLRFCSAIGFYTSRLVLVLVMIIVVFVVPIIVASSFHVMILFTFSFDACYY